MPNYQEYACPVCKKQFQKDDDIVTCPECGTPHHRECYSLVGNCVNKGLHSAGYSFLENEKTIPPVVVSEYYVPDDNEEEVEVIEDLVNSKEKDNNQGGKGFSPFLTVDFDTNAYKGTGKIGECDVQDIASVVRSNIPKFIEKFRKIEENGQKLGWNWSAFFFGSLYLLFRKMYKQGVAVYCIVLSIIFGCETLIYKFAPEFVAQVQKITEEAYNSKATSIDFSSLVGIADMQNAMKITYAMIGIILVIRIIVAIFADNIYKNTVFDIIKKVEEKLAGGANFTQTSFMMGQGVELSQEQLKKMYLNNKGGVSIFAPFFAYSIVYFIISFI